MSEQDGTQSSTKQRRSRKTIAANQENCMQAPAAQRPANDEKEAWKVYWVEQGQSWRTEPEIDTERRKYLEICCAITPDIKQGIYPFKDIKLSRADIEWLLVTHENGLGPIDWSAESQRSRIGLDLRGAVLSHENLSCLPLTCMIGGLTQNDWTNATAKQRKMAAVHLDKADLSKIHLEGAQLRRANLEQTDLHAAHLEKADLTMARLIGSYLKEAHFEDANMRSARLENTNLTKTNLERANLRFAMFSTLTNLETIMVGNEHTCFQIADVRWENVNLSMIDWKRVKILGDEYRASQREKPDGKAISEKVRLFEYELAVRAYRPLAAVLRNQGLSEDAARFTYRAQLMQRKVFWIDGKYGQYLFSLFLDLLSGYGYKPGRCFFAYLLVIFTFATAYFIIGHKVEPALSPLGSVVFSMTSFHGRGFFPGGIGLDNPLTVVAAFEAFIGLLIEVTFIATLTQRLFSK